jgi:hypothetical protein
MRHVCTGFGRFLHLPARVWLTALCGHCHIFCFSKNGLCRRSVYTRVEEDNVCKTRKCDSSTYTGIIYILMTKPEVLQLCNAATIALSTFAALCSQTAPAAAPPPASALPEPPPCSAPPDQTCRGVHEWQCEGEAAHLKTPECWQQTCIAHAVWRPQTPQGHRRLHPYPAHAKDVTLPLAARLAANMVSPRGLLVAKAAR